MEQEDPEPAGTGKHWNRWNRKTLNQLEQEDLEPAGTGRP